MHLACSDLGSVTISGLRHMQPACEELLVHKKEKKLHVEKKLQAPSSKRLTASPGYDRMSL